jgi:glycosyltransferase involved in cell wall biosynthesis
MQQRKVLFLVLTAFSSMGGIEKFNRALMKAFTITAPELNLQFSAAGMYDDHCDESYISSKQFQPFHGNKAWFVIKNLFSSFFKDELVLGHINLAYVGLVFKLLNPRKKLTVICHGIEVFDELKGVKKKLLHKADRLLAVSTFTKQQLVNKQKLGAEKITVFPNTLDPYFQLPEVFQKPAHLQQRYRLHGNEKVLFTLTRLNSAEGYKGYDKVIKAVYNIKQSGIKLRYLLAGKADEKEKQAVQQLISQLQLEAEVTLCGYIPDEEVEDHYLLADVFVMPSKGEGFGIVYLEAMACGLPVIAGNKDGSTEALQFGKLGTLVDPDVIQQLQDAIVNQLQKQSSPAQVQQNMLQYFSFEHFTNRLQVCFAAM